MAPHLRRTWAPRGQTPVLTQRGRSRRKVSVIAALTISPRRKRVRGYFGFLPDANYDGLAILAFVKALARTLRVPIELVWDRLQAHHRGPVGAWLGRHRSQCAPALSMRDGTSIRGRRTLGVGSGCSFR
jgi:hypothetical protein